MVAVMDPVLPPEYESFRSSVRGFVQQHGPSLTRQFDFDQLLSAADVTQMWSQLRGHGILDEVPKREDGAIDWIATGLIVEALATTDACLSLLWWSDQMLRTLVHAVMSEAQRTRYAHLFTPDHRWAGAFSEAGAGSDMANMATTAGRDGEGWVINGAKLWITAADKATVLLVACRLDSKQSRVNLAEPHQVGVRPLFLRDPILEDANSVGLPDR